MMCLISVIFALNTLLWALHFKRDIQIMNELLDEHLGNPNNQHESVRLMANALIVINVSGDRYFTNVSLRPCMVVCLFRQRGCVACLGNRKRKQAGTACMRHLASFDNA